MTPDKQRQCNNTTDLNRHALSLMINSDSDLTWVAALRSLKKPGFGLVLFLIGMHLMYFLPLLIPSSMKDGAAASTWRYGILARILIFAGAFLEAKASGFWLLKRHPIWTGWSIVAIFLTSIISVMDGAGFIEILTRQHAFIWMLLIPAVVLRSNNWVWLLMTLTVHAVIGILHGLYQIVGVGEASRVALILENDRYLFFTSALYMGLFLLLLTPSFRVKSLRVLAISAYVVLCINEFFAAQRYPLLLIPAELLILTYCVFRTTLVRGAIFRGAMVLLLALALIACIWQFVQTAPETQGIKTMVIDADEQLMKRMTNKGDFSSTISNNERWAEVIAGMKSMTWWNWLIGKGVVPTDLAPGMIVAGGIHNTYANSFYWGGIPLFIMVIIPLLWALKVFWRSREPVGLGCAAFMLIVYLKFPAYVITTDTLYWLLFCIALGCCARSEALLTQALRDISPGKHIRRFDRRSA